MLYRRSWWSLLACAASTATVLLAETILGGVPRPIGQWEFDDPQNLLKATTGTDLQLRGTQLAIAGPQTGNGAVRIGVGSHYLCAHGIAPNGSGTLVNRFSLLVDFRIAALGPWYCFFQTDPANQNDGDCFVRANDGAIGVGQTGYSTTRARGGAWQRLIVSADHAQGLYRIYLDGELILNGAPQAVDGRFALRPALLLFADENGEDGVIDVARVALYDVNLSAADAAELGGAITGDPDNHPPTILSGPAGVAETVTGRTEVFSVRASDPDQDTVQVRLDWGDGSNLSPWCNVVVSGAPVAFAHAWGQPGLYEIRALARDTRGQVGQWTAVQTVSVVGAGVVQFLTAPYLQNVRSNALTIMWELDVGVDAVVEYGPDTTYGLQATSTHAPSGGGTEIYRCALTGLTPGTTYQFRTRVDGQAGPGGTFTTAPVGTADFSFAVWSDSQGSNHGAYDADPLEPTKRMLRHMATNDIQFGVGVGDLAEDGGSYSDTRRYYLDRVAGLLGISVPWFVAWGNHDGGPTTVIRRFSDLPSQQRPGYTSGYGSYSFDYAGCHFICLDYASNTTDIQTWLETDLQSAANRNARFTFLFVHVPPYCELWIDGSSFLRSALVPLMEKYGVDVCFSGHTHEYSRGFRNGVHYCITGGGSWLDFPEVLVADWEHMTVGGYHDIPGVIRPGPDRGGGLVNEYVRVDVHGDAWTASMIAFAPDGTELGLLDWFAPSGASGSPLQIVRVTPSGTGLRLEWTGPPGPYQIQQRSTLSSGTWQDAGLPIGAAERSAVVPADGTTGFYRLRLAR